MPRQLSGVRVAVLVMDGFERVQLTESRNALEEAGADVHIVSPEGDWVRGWSDNDWWAPGVTVDVDLPVADHASYHALVLPGGLLNDASMRTNPGGIGFVRHFVEDGRPIGAVGHGPWMLIEADGVRGRRITSDPALRTDLLNAGAEWVDSDVVVDDPLITSRRPDDLGAFVEVLKAKLAEAR